MNQKNQSSILLVNKVRNFIIKKNLVFENQNILIAFSGGQDSLSLLIFILQFKNQFQFSFGLISCNHLWSLDHIYKLSHLLKISFIIYKPIFFSIASKKRFTESKARTWRYSLMYRISSFYNYEIVITGHTLTDQIETLLLNLYRSSSKSGLTSLYMKQFIKNKLIKKIFISRNELSPKI